MLSEFLLLCASIILIAVIHFVKSNPKRMRNNNATTSPIKGVYYQSDISHGRYDSPYVKYKNLNNRNMNSNVENPPRIPSNSYTNVDNIKSSSQFNPYNSNVINNGNNGYQSNLHSNNDGQNKYHYSNIQSCHERDNNDKYFNYYMTSSDKKSMLRKEQPLITPPHLSKNNNNISNISSNQFNNQINSFNFNNQNMLNYNQHQNNSYFSSTSNLNQKYSVNNHTNNQINNSSLYYNNVGNNIVSNTNNNFHNQNLQNNYGNQNSNMIFKECFTGNVINAEKLEMYLSTNKENNVGISVLNNTLKNKKRDSPNYYYMSDKKEDNSVVNNTFFVNSDFRMTFASNKDEEIKYQSNLRQSMIPIQNEVKSNHNSYNRNESFINAETNRRLDFNGEKDKNLPNMFDYMTSNVKSSDNLCFKKLVEESNKRINSELKSNTKELKEKDDFNSKNLISSIQDNKENVNDNNISIIINSISKNDVDEKTTIKLNENSNFKSQRRSFVRNGENVRNSSAVINKTVNTGAKSVADMIKEAQLKDKNINNETIRNDEINKIGINENIARNLNFYDISINAENLESSKLGNVTPNKAPQLNLTEIKEILMASNLNLNKSLSNAMSHIKNETDLNRELDISELKYNDNSVLWTPPRDSKKGAELFDSFGKS